jgi:type IV pilus assembly protein PilN
MLRLPVNIASEPFRRDRPLIVASVATGILLVALLGVLISLAISERGQAADLRREIASLQGQAQGLSAEQLRLGGVLRQPENAIVLERSQFLNSLLYRKGISWTKIFDDLEKVLPHNVRIIQVRPQVNGANEVVLDMLVGAESAEPVIEMLRKMEGSPQFGATHLLNRLPPSQNEPLLRYRVSVNYAQQL